MNILAFDSTAVTASVAVTRDETVLAAARANNGLTHSEILLPMAEAMLDAAGVVLDGIDLFACTAGPGSFTGVRIGTATVKGLAFGRGKPCVGVSTLEALAEGLSPLPGILIGVMDARRAQVYCGIFTMREGLLTRLAPDRAMPLADLVTEVMRDYPEAPIRLAGDGYDLAYAAFLAAGCPGLTETPEALRCQSGAAVARCALRAYRAGLAVTDEELRPVYLRLPQAERDLIEKQKPTEKEQGATS